MLALLEILQQGGWMTIADLARRIGVDERTVRRYAAQLSDIGIPVESRRGRYGGYRLAPGYKLPPLMFTDDEAVAVVLGLAAGRRAGMAPADSTAVDSATAKLRRVLPAALARRTDALLATIDFTGPARRSAPPGTEVLLVLAEAARDRHPVHLSYTSWHGRASERDLDPYGLVFHAGRWYVTGRDHTSREVRTFRLDRIGTVCAAEGTFEVPAGFDPTGHVISRPGLGALRPRHLGPAAHRPRRGTATDPPGRRHPHRGRRRGTADDPGRTPRRRRADARGARLALHHRTTRRTTKPGTPARRPPAHLRRYRRSPQRRQPTPSKHGLADRDAVAPGRRADLLLIDGDPAVAAAVAADPDAARTRHRSPEGRRPHTAAARRQLRGGSPWARRKTRAKYAGSG